MSGRDEQLFQETLGYSIEYYREWIRHVIEFMNNSDLSLTESYTIKELEGFVILSGLMLPMYWVEIIARGVRRTIFDMFTVRSAE